MGSTVARSPLDFQGTSIGSNEGTSGQGIKTTAQIKLTRISED
jgi:hypothetical protein